MYYYLVYQQDNDIVANIASDILRLRQEGHCPFLDMAVLKQQQTVKLVLLIYDVCSFEEDSRRDLKIKTPRMFWLINKGLLTARIVNYHQTTLCQIYQLGRWKVLGTLLILESCTYNKMKFFGTNKIIMML